jgi:type III restriction enzyme
MRIDLFPFQKIAVESLRHKADFALQSYAATRTPQIVSLQAPTGSGKTVMMTAFIENVLFGDERHDEKPNAVFVWLSDSPTLNQQSKEKIDVQSDKIKFGQTVIVEDASFDRETFEDGHIYFINTQKLSRAGNLGQKSDGRQFTIWQTIQNTVEQKSDRLVFIIDEAHRGMQGTEGGRQTAIMQRFLRGWTDVGLSPMPVVVGMSATPERFHKLVEQLSSTIAQELVPTEDVRASGLLKDRIIITYPEDQERQDAMAVLAAATKEWLDKCEHWQFYCVNQHYRNVNPVFVIQVKAASAESPVSETDLDAALAKIAEVSEISFTDGQIVHTFGSTGDLTINGFTVRHVDPGDIADDRNIRIVFFKENLSTGWDCPRAETMMSFRRAEDYTYIAQLLGRMIRTPLQCHVTVDDSLNDVKLYLPYFDATAVDRVIEELRASECGEIPSFVGGELLGSGAYSSWGVQTRIRRRVEDPNQLKLFANLPEMKPEAAADADDVDDGDGVEDGVRPVHPQQVPTPIVLTKIPAAADRQEPPAVDLVEPVSDTARTAPEKVEQPYLQFEIDRKDIIRRINQLGILRYNVRTRAQRVHDYLTALLSLAGLLSRTRVCSSASATVRKEIVEIMRTAVDEIRRSGQYKELERQIREMRMQARVFDVFGASLQQQGMSEFAFVSDWDVDRQLREADVVLGRAGLVNDYGREYVGGDEDAWKIDSIIFANDQTCMERVYAYAKGKFHMLNDEHRREVAALNERVQSEYDDIVASGDVVSKHNFLLPETIQGSSAPDGKLYGDHLYADEHGFARIKFDSRWEDGVIEEEERGGDFVCWLRNPPRQKWSLCIPYQKDNEFRAFYPDFLIVRRDANRNSESGYIVDILEPHGEDFDDNLAKAQGLAKYAQEERHFGRIQMIRKETGVGGVCKFRRLDLNKGSVREKVLAAKTNDELRHLFETDGSYYELAKPKSLEVGDVDALIASFNKIA